MARVKCYMSHEVPGIEGRFTVYEAGKEYDITNPDEKFFKPLPPPVPPVTVSKRKAREADNDSN